MVYRTLRLAQLLTVISDTVRATAMIALIMAGAFVFNYAVANEGVPQLIRNTFMAWNLSPIGFLLCVDVLMLLLAIVLDEVTILLVIVPLLVPIAQGLGIDLVHFGIVDRAQHDGRAHFAAARPAAVRDERADRHAARRRFSARCRRFIVTMLAIVVLVTFFPELALWVPRVAGLMKP